MNDAARELLRGAPKPALSPWVFPNERKLPLNGKNFVWRVFLPALEAAGIIGFRWHDLSGTRSRVVS